jgi:WD40 repeat protein
MSLSRKHFAAAALVLSLACLDQPTEPSNGAGGLQVRPMLPSGMTMASFNLVIDSVYVEIYVYDTTACGDCEAAVARPGGAARVAAAGRLDTVLVAQTFYWDPAAQSLPLSFDVPVIPPNHIFQLYIAMSAASQPLFYGYADLGQVRGNIRIPPIDVLYFGPGYNADSIAVTPGDTVAKLTDTLYFDATAFQGGVPLDTAYIGWRTTDSTKARISYTGQLTFRPAMAGSTVGVIGLVPNGITAETVYVSVAAIASAIQRASGDSQTAPALTLLPLQLGARVLRAGGAPNAGVLVKFSPLGVTGTTVTDSLVYTDSLGIARTGVLLGSVVGGVNIEAMVAANTSIKVAFHATIGPALPAPIIYVSDSFSVTGALRQVQANGTGRATITALTPAGIQQALPRWAPSRQRAVYSANNGSFIGLWLINTAGDSSANYVTDVDAFRPRFSPDGSHIAFQCGSIQDDDQTGQVCVGGGVAGGLNILAGAGDNGLRVLLTDKVLTRTGGPTSYAWNPVSPTEIAIVRDSVADTTFAVHSAIYRIDAGGTGLALLSAPSIDLGKGPLKIMGPMDWSPDGSTIVFSAREPSVNESALYLLDVATGAVAQLTAPTPTGFGDRGDRMPVFSPNGSEVLFLRVLYSGDGMDADYHVVRVSDGSVRQVGYEGGSWSTSSLYSLSGDWSPDGQTLLLAGLVSSFQTLYLVPADVSSASEYTTQRTLIGDATGANSVSDQVGSWRP